MWTRDAARALRVGAGLDIGIVWINDHHRIDPASPWGGFKDSGIGSENGLEAYRVLHPGNRASSSTPPSIPFDWFATVDLRYS